MYLMIYFFKKHNCCCKVPFNSNGNGVLKVKYVVIIIIIFRSIVMTYIESTSRNIFFHVFSRYFFTQFSGGSNRLNIDKFLHSALLRSIL